MEKYEEVHDLFDEIPLKGFLLHFLLHILVTLVLKLAMHLLFYTTALKGSGKYLAHLVRLSMV